jgi:hypothetical protein
MHCTKSKLTIIPWCEPITSWMIRLLEFLPFWQTDMPTVLSTYVYVGYCTKKFTLLVTPLTISVRVFFAFIFGKAMFLPVM